MAFTDEDPSVRMPLPDQVAHPDDDERVIIPIDTVSLRPGVSCVDQFKEFFPTHDMNNAMRISQDDRKIDLQDPYIAYLLEDPVRIDNEIDNLKAYLRVNVSTLMPMHGAILRNFMTFLNRLQTYAELARPEPRVIIPLDRSLF